MKLKPPIKKKENKVKKDPHQKRWQRFVCLDGEHKKDTGLVSDCAIVKEDDQREQEHDKE